MIKVLWFLKRSDGQSLEEFHNWWIHAHAPAICEDQRPYLAKYVIDTTLENANVLPGNSKGDDLDWDGVGIQYFKTESDYLAVYNRTDRPTTGDTLNRVKAKCRLIVRENEIDTDTGVVKSA